MHPHGFVGERARRAEFLRCDLELLESCRSWRLLEGVLEDCPELGSKLSRYRGPKGAY